MVNLTKGQKVELTKGNAGLTRIRVGLGWDVNEYAGGGDFDLDASAFALGADGKTTQQGDMVFYNNPSHPSGSIQYMGDNRNGEGDGDDESLEVDLSRVPANIEKIAFTVTIYDGQARNQNFGQINNAYIHIMNAENGEELVRFDLTEDFSIETALVVGTLYRHEGEWKFTAVGAGYQGGMEALCNNFGVY